MATSQNLQDELEKKLHDIALHGRQDQAAHYARQLGLPFSDLKGIPIDTETLALLDENASRTGNIALIYKSGTTVIAAVVDPKNQATESVLNRLKERGFSVKLLMTTPEGLETVLSRYASITSTETFEVGAIEINEQELDALQASIKDLSDLRNQVSGVAVTRLLEILIAGALKTSASDIHFEPEAGTTRLRYRLDGLLHDVTTLDPDYYVKILNRVKILSKLKLNIHSAPQDGRFTIRQKETAIEVRVSILPSEYGETIVMRLLDPRSINTRLEDLGMRPDTLKQVRLQLQKPNGAILTTGPTGSGKTTTLYAFVTSLNTPDAKIITVEDPIEYHITGISQTQIDPAKGYTFANGLRAIVRQDPDIILIGEIRDTETADIALHAALTGHLVFSTIHTNDAAGTIPRLLDLGIKPETIAPAIIMAMGQRLVRRLCPNCRIEGTLPPGEAARINESLEPIRKQFNLPAVTEKTPIQFPGKCAECNELGYKGRVGVYEVFTVSKAVEELIMTSPSISAVRDLAIAEGMVTMLQDGYMKLLEGITSLEEVRRILG